MTEPTSSDTTTARRPRDRYRLKQPDQSDAYRSPWSRREQIGIKSFALVWLLLTNGAQLHRRIARRQGLGQPLLQSSHSLLSLCCLVGQRLPQALLTASQSLPQALCPHTQDFTNEP